MSMKLRIDSVGTRIAAIPLVIIAALLLVVPRAEGADRTTQAAAKGTATTDMGAPIVVGLDADMSKGAAQGGEAIRRGIVIAIDEINAAGGVLGRPLKLVVRDHRGNPARGVDNINDFAEMEDLVAVVGGVHTPVALAELESLHEHEIIYLGPWAAGTPIVENGRNPNYVFRLSVRDQYAGGFLINAARERGYKRPGLLLWRTGWGRSNEKAMTDALHQLGQEPAGVQWFNSSQKDMSQEIKALIDAGADVVMLVANPVDGVMAVNSMAELPAGERLPIISHWGITGGDFHAQAAGVIESVELTFLQTYSFFEPPFPERAAHFSEAYCAAFGGCRSTADIISPVGTAHAYDLIHLLKLAIEEVGTIDRKSVRDALERIEHYSGLVRDYAPPFTSTRHDALDASDFRLCRYDRTGAIVPVAVQ